MSNNKKIKLTKQMKGDSDAHVCSDQSSFYAIKYWDAYQRELYNLD